MKIDHGAILKRMRTKMKKKFPINCRVRMTRVAAKQWPKYAQVTGTVVRHSNGISPCVLWDGRKTDSGYHPGFFSVKGVHPPRRRDDMKCPLAAEVTMYHGSMRASRSRDSRA